MFCLSVNTNEYKTWYFTVSTNHHPVFSTLIGRGMSRLGSHWARDVAAPALLCHKEPARRIQSPLLGALERKIPPLGGILLAPRWFFMA